MNLSKLSREELIDRLRLTHIAAKKIQYPQILNHDNEIDVLKNYYKEKESKEKHIREIENELLKHDDIDLNNLSTHNLLEVLKKYRKFYYQIPYPMYSIESVLNFQRYYQFKIEAIKNILNKKQVYQF